MIVDDNAADYYGRYSLHHICLHGPCRASRVPGAAYCAEHELMWIALSGTRSNAPYGVAALGDRHEMYARWRDSLWQQELHIAEHGRPLLLTPKEVSLEREEAVGTSRDRLMPINPTEEDNANP